MKDFVFRLQVNELWSNCLKLPIVIHNWHAFKELKDSINIYLEVFPILHQLASKVLINISVNEVNK